MKKDFVTVLNGFDRELFLSLNPPGMPARLLRFDGCRLNDEVHLKIWVLGIWQDWISKIVEVDGGDTHYTFVDEGRKLPFFLSSWRHIHGINERDKGTTEITDDISYKTPFFLLDYLLYPLLYLTFYYRKSAYRKYFLAKG